MARFTDFQRTDDKGFVLFIVIVLIAVVVAITGISVSFLDNIPGTTSDRKAGKLAQTAAETGVSTAISEIQMNTGSQTYSNPMWATFFQDTDINGDGIIARDGEDDINRDGKFEVSIFEVFNKKDASRDGVDDDGDGVVDDLPHIFYLSPPMGLNAKPEIAPTLEDVNGNKKQNMPDGILEDAFGNKLFDGFNEIVNEDIGTDSVRNELEPGYHPIDNPDPNSDNYHPIFNPSGTEGNGKRDLNEPDSINIGKFDTIENGLQKWLRYSRRIPMGTSTPGIGANPRAYFGNISLKVTDTNSRINLNGPDILTARLLNNLLRVVELVPKAFPLLSAPPETDNILTTFIDERGDGKDSDGDSIVDDGSIIGQNSRGIEYDCSLDTTIGSSTANLPNNIGTETLHADDSDAVLIVKYRNSLPGKLFNSVDQLLNVFRPLSPGTLMPSLCTSPQLALNAGPIFDIQNINRDAMASPIFIDNIDEFEKLKEFVTVTGWKDMTTVKPNPDQSDPVRLVIEPRFPVGLNTASNEVLHAVIATGLMTDDNLEDDRFNAAGKLAGTITVHRLLKGPIKGWNEFDDFMDVTIGTNTERFGSSDLTTNNILLKNKERLIAQFRPDTLLQSVNPNRLLVRPLDKTHIDSHTTELSLAHSGYYEIDSMAITTSQVSTGIDQDILLQLGIVGTTTSGAELGRREIIATVKTMDILKHTTEKQFEDFGTASVFKSFKTKSMFRVSSYPDNMRDIPRVEMGGQTSRSLSFSPNVIEVDEVTGNVYVGGDSSPTISILKYSDNIFSPVLEPIGTILLPGPVQDLAIDPLFTSTDFGRLYVVISGDPDITVFDIMGTTTSGILDPRQRKNIKGDATAIPIKIALDFGNKVITAITDIVAPDMLEWRYPPGDVHALPEIEDLGPTSKHTLLAPDPDNDGFPNDTKTDPEGRPETLIDNEDKDFDGDPDGEIDDSIRPKATQPKNPSLLSTLPFKPNINFSELLNIVFDDNQEQFFVIDTHSSTGTSTIINFMDSIGTHTVDKLMSTETTYLASSFIVDSNDSIIYVLGSSTTGTDELIKYSTTGTPTAFPEIDRLPLGSVTTGIKNIVIDKDEDLLFILRNEGAQGTVTAINARNERMQIVPIGQLGTTTTNATDVAIDSRRKRVYIAEGSSNRIKAFEYKVNKRIKQTFIDGQIQLTHNSKPGGNSENILYHSDFYSDFNIMGTNTVKQFGTETPILFGTGTPILIVNGGIQTPFINNSLFVPSGTTSVRLTPDGILTQTLSTSGTVTGSVVSYDPVSLFGGNKIGTVTVDSQGLDSRGIRKGSVELWIKFPQITNPWAVPEIGANATDLKDNDGDGVIGDGITDDTSTSPEGGPEINAENGIDDDNDGYVDDIVGIDNNLNKPAEIILLRSFYEVPIENDIFVHKNNDLTGTATLGNIMGTTTVILPGFEFGTFGTPTPTSTYTVFSKLSLKDFGDSNSDGLIDNANLELERFSFPGTITVSGTSTGIGGGSFSDVKIFPGSVTTNLITATNTTFQAGEWKNIAYNWWIETTGSNTEKLRQEMFIDGAPFITGIPYGLGTDTSILLGTITARLDDLPPDISPFFHIGTKIPGMMTTGGAVAFMATFDDMVINNGTASVSSGTQKRFASAFGTSIPSRGDPYQDYNLNFKRDSSGNKFDDKNGNGLFDLGEAFDMGSSTTMYYDYSGEFYAFYGERFTDTTNPPNEFTSVEASVDYNRNTIYDKGELYIDLDMDGPTIGANVPDTNLDRRLDDSGYIIRNFDTVIPAGSMIGAIAWTEYLPLPQDSTDVSFELTLKALDGKILWRWFGGDGTSTGTRIDLPAPEDSILEYRANLIAVGTQTVSPVIDDITVTIIKKSAEIISINEVETRKSIQKGIGPNDE